MKIPKRTIANIAEAIILSALGLCVMSVSYHIVKWSNTSNARTIFVVLLVYIIAFIMTSIEEELSNAKEDS